MTALPIDEQIRALLDGKFYELLKQYLRVDLSRVDIRSYITISRQDIVTFLQSNPEIANTYLEKFQRLNLFHDTAGITKEGDSYQVYWLDYGHKRDVENFSNLNEAIAAHVLINVGLY